MLIGSIPSDERETKTTEIEGSDRRVKAKPLTSDPRFINEIERERERWLRLEKVLSELELTAEEELIVAEGVDVADDDDY